METRKILTAIANNTTAIFLIIISVLLRLLPHLPNMAPIGALALFSGAHYRGKKMFLIPFVAIVVSDMILGFYKELPFVYGSYLLIIGIGMLIKKQQKLPILAGASLSSSLLFFVITNFGVWAISSWYAKNISGLLNAYILAIPFFRNTVIGDVIYTFSFFYGYRYLSLFLKNNNYVVSKFIKISR